MIKDCITRTWQFGRTEIFDSCTNRVSYVQWGVFEWTVTITAFVITALVIVAVIGALAHDGKN